MIPVGETIKRLRREKGITQDELAKVLDVKRTTVASWERNARVPQTDTARKMADLFHVPLSVIVPDGNAPKQYVSIGKRLEQLIDLQSISFDDELAEQLGVTMYELESWIDGSSTPDFQELARIADFFGVTMATVRGETKEIVDVNPLLPDVDMLVAKCPELIDLLHLWPKIPVDQRQQLVSLIKSLALAEEQTGGVPESAKQKL